MGASLCTADSRLYYQQIHKDLSQYNLKIQQLKNEIQDQLNEEKLMIETLKEQEQISRQNIDNEQKTFQNLFMQKIELQGYLSESIQKLSTEKQKEYEKEIEELKKSANQLNFEKKPSGLVQFQQASLNGKEQLQNLIKETEELQIEFRQFCNIIPQYNEQKEIDQFNKIYLEIKTIELEMKIVEENFDKLSKEIQINNHILSESKDFNQKMASSLIKFENQIKTKFNEIYSFINKQQTENIQEISIKLNKQIQLSQHKQAELDDQIKIIKNLKQKAQEFQNQITQYECENDLDINLNNKLKQQIKDTEKKLNQEIENLEQLKDENTTIIKQIKILRIQFEEKISKFEFDLSQIQIEIEKNKINEIIENQITFSQENNQIIDNFKQIMNISLIILKIQNDRLISIQSELEKTQQINQENQETIGKQNKQITKLKLQSINKNKYIGNLQNQIEQLEQNNFILIKEVGKYRLQQEPKKANTAFSESQWLSTARGSLYQSFRKFSNIDNTKNQQNKIKGIDIFYESETPYNHLLCKTRAKVNSDAIVSCDGGCPSYHLKFAVFDLLNSQVYQQVDIQQLPKNHVQLGRKCHSLVDSSLSKAGIVDKEQTDFLQKFTDNYYQQGLSYSHQSQRIYMKLNYN